MQLTEAIGADQVDQMLGPMQTAPKTKTPTAAAESELGTSDQSQSPEHWTVEPSDERTREGIGQNTGLPDSDPASAPPG